ncbi:unnamed protein product [Toxocara canis]|uniref:ARID domain-containing protein n=1 Tax=Toxocara canis TaxID=6265 RepID=A0A183V630_TOXCA|nr:unnamed protein product [Toxocara canis]
MWNALTAGDDGEEPGSEWSKWNFMKANRKQSAVHAVAGQYSDVYTVEGFLQNDSVEEVLPLIFSDSRRGLLKFSYRMWALNRLGINPLKEVTCRLNWSEVVPICLQRDVSEDGRVKNALRKYISNYIYNCRQTIVVRENRDELNRIKTLGLSKERLRKAIAQLVNKTSNQHGWTLYRPIPSYIMRNISGVRNKANKEKQQMEQVSVSDAVGGNVEQRAEQFATSTVKAKEVETPPDINKGGTLSSVMKRVFVRGMSSALRDSYRDEAIAALGFKDWLCVNVAEVDYTPVIPQVLQADPLLARKVQSRLSAYVAICVRKARIKVMIKKYADELLRIRENFTKETVPEALLVELIRRASDENGWDGQIPSTVGLKGEIDWEVSEGKEEMRELDQASDELPPTSLIELDSYKSAMREVFDSKRHIRASFRQYAFDALNICATMRGDPSALDFSTVVPKAFHQQPTTLHRITRQLAWSASSKVLSQRRALIMQKRAAQMANIRRQYPTSKDVPRELIKEIIDQVYAEEEWGEHKPAVEPFINKLYEYTMSYVEKLGECNLEEIAESEEASCSKSGSLHEEDALSDVSSLRRGEGAQLRRSERNLHKRSIDESDVPVPECKRKMISPTVRQADVTLADFDDEQCSDQGSLEAAIKGLFERDVKGPLSSTFRRRVVEELGVTMSFSGILEELDYSSLIPLAIRRNKQVHEQVRQQIITYLIGFIRRSRLTYIAEERAPQLVELLKQYPKQNTIPLNALYALIHQIAKEKGWKRYLPLASKLKYRIYERRELITKRASVQTAQHTQQRIPPALATAIVATGSAVTPIQTTMAKNKRSSLSSLLAIGGKSVFATPDGEESQAVSSTTLASVASSSRRSLTAESSSDSFMHTMKNKLKDLSPEEMSVLMNRINEHVREKMVAQLASQIVQNFDPSQQDSMFNEILGIVDSHKTASP